jgi:hypothetical protein
VEPTKLECGCEFENILGRIMWIFCEEHDTNNEIPVEKPIKKFRKNMDYE